MAKQSKPVQILHENSFLFGLRWSALGAMLAIVLLSGCTAFNVEVPRYNTVIGEKRVPKLNPGGAVAAPRQQAADEVSAPQPQATDYYAAYHEEEAPQVWQEAQTRQLGLNSVSEYAVMQAAPQQGYYQAYPNYQQQPLPQAYPQLPATMQEQWEATPADMSSLQSEIAALEAELAQSQHQQVQAVAAPVNYQQQPLPQQAYQQQPVAQPMPPVQPVAAPVAVAAAPAYDAMPVAAPAMWQEQPYVNNGANAYGAYAQPQAQPVMQPVAQPQPEVLPEHRAMPAGLMPQVQAAPAPVDYQSQPLPPFALPVPPQAGGLNAYASQPVMQQPAAAAPQGRRVPSQQPQMAGYQPPVETIPPVVATMPAAAPVIDEQMASMHAASAPAMAVAASASAVDVPLMPDVKGSAYRAVPSALVPPSMEQEISAGYLPGSRYASRR